MHVNLLLYFYILPCGYYYLHVFFFRGSSFRGIARSEDKSTSRGSRPSHSRGVLGLPGSIFLSGKFRVVHAEDSTVYRRASKTTTNKPPQSLRVRRPTSSRRGLLLEPCNSPIGRTSKKNHVHVRITPLEEYRNTVIKLHAIYSMIISKFTSNIRKKY